MLLDKIGNLHADASKAILPNPSLSEVINSKSEAMR